MRTKLVFIAIITTTLLTFLSSCKKDDKSSFDYPMETVYGTWSGTDVYLEESNKWVDITKYPYTQLAFSIKFNSNNTYYGYGAFGTGNGTYEALGKTIITYVADKEYARYDVISLSSTTAELNMHMGKSSVKIKVKKQ